MSDDIVQPVSVEVEQESASDAPVPVVPAIENSEPVAPTEDADVLESAPVGKEEDSFAPVAEPAPTPAVDAAPNEHSAESVSVAPTPEPQVREVIIEKEKPLTEADKDAIFKNKLKDNLTSANTRKQQKHEAHLKEIIDFIRKKGTLVTNQDIEEVLQIPDTTVTDRLNELIQRGKVQRLGDRRNAKYRLVGAV
ncbi:MAG: hypothetical protein WC659_00150 [Patescibacteria group bacterium]